MPFIGRLEGRAFFAIARRASNLDGLTTTAVGHMLIGIFGALAQYERTLINERSAAAREAARARARGRHVGRPAALTSDQIRQLRALHAGGEGVSALVATFGVSRATVYRLLAEEAAPA